MSCHRCIELDTPETVMVDGNRYYEEGTDVFYEVFQTNGGTFANAPLMKQALWWRYRDHIIGNCDTTVWVRGMADRLGLIGAKWDEIISKAIAEDVELASIVDRAYRKEIRRTAIEGTDGDVRVLSHEGSDVVASEHESLPQTATGTTVYLDSRDKATTTPGVVDTDKYTPNNKETETFEADDSLTALTFSEMMRNYPDVLISFTDEFADYFVPRWYV